MPLNGAQQPLCVCARAKRGCGGLLTRGLCGKGALVNWGKALVNSGNLTVGLQTVLDLWSASINMAEWWEVSYKVGLGICVCVFALWGIGGYEIYVCVCVCVF